MLETKLCRVITYNHNFSPFFRVIVSHSPSDRAFRFSDAEQSPGTVVVVRFCFSRKVGNLARVYAGVLRANHHGWIRERHANSSELKF